MNTLRILLVDDHAPFRRFLAEFLRVYPGIEIVGEAENGLDAVRQAEHLHPGLVFMDLTMPGMNGFDATRRIKERCPDTRVVVLSSHTGDVYRRAAEDSHADGYIEKQALKSGLSALLSAELPIPVRAAV